MFGYKGLILQNLSFKRRFSFAKTFNVRPYIKKKTLSALINYYCDCFSCFHY